MSTDNRPPRLMLRLKEPTRERLMILAREAGVAPLDYIRQIIEASWSFRVDLLKVGSRMPQDRSEPCGAFAFGGKRCTLPKGHSGLHTIRTL